MTLQIINEKIINMKLFLISKEYSVYDEYVYNSNDILLRIVRYSMYITYDIETTKLKREKEIEKVNGWRKENDTWRERRRSNSTLGFLFSALSSRRHPFSDIVLFPFYFFVRHSSPVQHAYDPTRMGTRTRKAARGRHGVVTIVIYISFLFVSMTTSSGLRQWKNE